MIQLYKLNEFQIKFRLKRMFIMLAFKRIKPMHSIINNRHVAFLFSHGRKMANDGDNFKDLFTGPKISVHQTEALK